VVQCGAVWCSVLQCVAVLHDISGQIRVAGCAQCVAGVLQCVAVCCSALQCIAVCCSVLQCVAGVLHCVAVWCRVLQCVALYCSVLQCVAVSYIYRVLQCIAVSHSRSPRAAATPIVGACNKFCKVHLLLYQLCPVTLELAFENFDQPVAVSSTEILKSPLVTIFAV